MNKETLFTTAWTLARQAAARLGGAARAHFGACLKAAWVVARAPQPVAVAAPVPTADEVPAYTAENSLRAVLGPCDAMQAFFDAHNGPGTVLLLGQLLDFNAALPANLRAGMFESLGEYEGFVRALVARSFRVGPATLAHVTLTADPVAAVEPAPAPVVFEPPVLTSHVRGGGVGGAAWVARITGPDAKWGLARQFVSKERNTSKSGRSGRIHFTLDRPGYYELRGMQYEAGVASIGTLDNSFILVGPDGSHERVRKADVIKAMGVTA